MSTSEATAQMDTLQNEINTLAKKRKSYLAATGEEWTGTWNRYAASGRMDATLNRLAVMA